jgi:hypothetical protein
MIRPRAADDFAMIRARMEELRRERALVPAEPQVRTEPPPRPNAPATRTAPSPAATTTLIKRRFLRLTA